MNLLDQFESLNINRSCLTDKKQHTTKKIEYISDYVNKWARIGAERDNTSVICFIDGMCNAGVYSDGDGCTAVEVLMIFSELCRIYPKKIFRIFFNDIDAERIDNLKKIIQYILPQKPSNLSLNIDNRDINDYLDNLYRQGGINGIKAFDYNIQTLLYVDPFNFGTVVISKLSNILKKYYCELLYNFFISDYVRNKKQDKGKLDKCLGGVQLETKEELIAYLRSQLKVGKIQFMFSYEFRIKSNTQLYQIIFATPNIKGLEKLKESLWKVFNGAQYHRNSEIGEQLTFLNEEHERNNILSLHSSKAIELLCETFGGKELRYVEIERFLIENTMLKDSQIIKNVLKPMLENKKMIKRGNVKVKHNYKDDCYYIAGNVDKL